MNDYSQEIFEKINQNKELRMAELEKDYKFNMPDFKKSLDHLISTGKISIYNDDHFYIVGKNERIGSIRINQKGFGFIKERTESENSDDFFVFKNDLNNSISGDAVLFKIEKNNDKVNAKVLKVINRTKKSLVGTIIKNKEYLDFVPNDGAYKNYFTKILKNHIKYKENDIVKAEIVEVKNNKLYVKISEIIGSNLKAIDKIIAIAYDNDISVGFSDEAKKEAKSSADNYYSDEKEKEVRLKNSLLDTNLVTIDGDDSKDLDDAIYVEKTNNGFRLIVSIADVSYFVREKSTLDKEALEKGNSTYLANRVLPMLPEVLSNGVCSLNPDQERFCIASIIDFDEKGNVIDKKVIKSIMKSKARLTYKEVNNFFKTGEINRPTEIIEMLKVARSLHEKIELLKPKKGTIEFELPEPKAILDENGFVKDIVIRPTGESEKLIENFMVSANEAVASIVYEKGLPFIYRNHPGPDQVDLLEWYSSLILLGIDTKVANENKSDPSFITKALSEIDRQIDDPKEKSIINLSLLKYMGKAYYGLNNDGHFGLASSCYTHFTSPIRRYSDLIVHRLLKKYIIENSYNTSEKNKIEDMIQKSSNIINVTEKQSINAERDTNKVCSAEYMQKFIGKEFDGVVSFIAKFGIFVQIDNCIEGMIHISNLEGFVFDEKTNTFVGPQNKFYKICSKVRVKLINADVVKKIIDFDVVK